MENKLVRNFSYAVPVPWFDAFITAHSAMFRLHTGWFGLSVGRLDAMRYAGMAVYKVGILLLNLVPHVALCVVAPGTALSGCPLAARMRRWARPATLGA